MTKAESSKLWRANNKERVIQYRKSNREKSLLYLSKYYQDNKELLCSRNRRNHLLNKKVRNQKCKDYNKKMKDADIASYRAKRNASFKKQLKSDVNAKIRHLLRSRIAAAIKQNVKGGSSVTDLGCTIPEFKVHIAKKFMKGMNWDNHGKWHLDHVTPLSAFNLENREQFLVACHYTNYQPLWAIDNICKSDRME